MKMPVKSLFTILFLLVSFMVSAQTLEDAQKAYNAAVAANNDSNYVEAITQFKICLEACEYLVEEQEDEQAEQIMITVQSVLPEKYLTLGQLQIKQKQVSEGLANVYSAMEAARKYGNKNIEDKAKKIIPQVHYSIAASLFKEDKLDEAIAECDKAILIDNNYASAYYIKAVVLKKKGDDAAFKSASLSGIAACKRINDTKNEQKIVELAYKYFLKKGVDAKGASKYDDAIANLNSALEFNANDATTYYLLASIYSTQAKYSEAIAAGQKSIEFETGNDEVKAKVYMIIAESQAKKGDNAAACAAYKKAAVGQYAESANYQIQHVLKCE